MLFHPCTVVAGPRRPSRAVAHPVPEEKRHGHPAALALEAQRRYGLWLCPCRVVHYDEARLNKAKRFEGQPWSSRRHHSSRRSHGPREQPTFLQDGTFPDKAKADDEWRALRRRTLAASPNLNTFDLWLGLAVLPQPSPLSQMSMFTSLR